MSHHTSVRIYRAHLVRNIKGWHAQVLLQAAFLAGNVQWAETREARRVLLLLGFPKAESLLDLIVVRPQGDILIWCCRRGL